MAAEGIGNFIYERGGVLEVRGVRQREDGDAPLHVHETSGVVHGTSSRPEGSKDMIPPGNDQVVAGGQRGRRRIDRLGR
jgi:hypothetical protein